MMGHIKPGLEDRILEKRGVSYIADEWGRPRRFTPWLGDHFAFFYDRIMEKSVFPKKFTANIDLHYRILSRQLNGMHASTVLELASGSGSAVHFLPVGSHYTGIDISPGLMRLASRRFADAGFEDSEFYVARAEDLPFTDDRFDLCLCVLSLNFFDDAETVLREAMRVLVRGGSFVCSVPVPERNTRGSTIRGSLYTVEELEEMCRQIGFDFTAFGEENGALFYFSARLHGAAQA